MEKEKVFSDIPAKNGWLLPAKKTSYTAAGQALLDKRKMPEEEIEDKETLHIAREAAQKRGGYWV